MAYFPRGSQAHWVLALSIKPVSFFFFFFEREKSIEIDLKMSNLINCQLSQQDRYFIGYYRCLISPRPFSWLHGITNQPTNFLMGPIREGGGVTKWPTGSATGFLLFILFNLALVLMAVWLWGEVINISELCKSLWVDFVGL